MFLYSLRYPFYKNPTPNFGTRVQSEILLMYYSFFKFLCQWYIYSKNTFHIALSLVHIAHLTKTHVFILRTFLFNFRFFHRERHFIRVVRTTSLTASRGQSIQLFVVFSIFRCFSVCLCILWWTICYKSASLYEELSAKPPVELLSPFRRQKRERAKALSHFLARLFL